MILVKYVWDNIMVIVGIGRGMHSISLFKQVDSQNRLVRATMLKTTLHHQILLLYARDVPSA